MGPNRAVSSAAEQRAFNPTVAGSIPARPISARPHRLEAQDTALSRRRRGFESLWGRYAVFGWRLRGGQPEPSLIPTRPFAPMISKRWVGSALSWVARTKPSLSARSSGSSASPMTSTPPQRPRSLIRDRGPSVRERNGSEFRLDVRRKCRSIFDERPDGRRIRSAAEATGAAMNQAPRPGSAGERREIGRRTSRTRGRRRLRRTGSRGPRTGGTRARPRPCRARSVPERRAGALSRRT